MAEILIVYGTKQGATQKMAEIIFSVAAEMGHQPILKNVFEVRVKDFVSYPLVLLGSSTWNDGDLQVDWLDMERELEELDMKGHWYGVFGPGSSRFPHFCEAVEILQARVRNGGGKLVIPSLKVDIMSGTLEDESSAWARKILTKAAGLNIFA